MAMPIMPLAFANLYIKYLKIKENVIFCNIKLFIPLIEEQKVTILILPWKKQNIWPCLKCAHVAMCLACLRVHVLTSLLCLRVHVAMCLACLRAHVGTCFACSRAHVQTCLECLRALCVKMLCVLMYSSGNVACELTCSRTYMSCVPCPTRLA